MSLCRENTLKVWSVTTCRFSVRDMQSRVSGIVLGHPFASFWPVSVLIALPRRRAERRVGAGRRGSRAGNSRVLLCCAATVRWDGRAHDSRRSPGTELHMECGVHHALFACLASCIARLIDRTAIQNPGIYETDLQHYWRHVKKFAVSHAATCGFSFVFWG